LPEPPNSAGSRRWWRELAEEGIQADLVRGNNVLAQVANLNSSVEGIRLILKPRGVCTIEFPHLLDGRQPIRADLP
jgi:hypothetical protein